MPLVRCTCRGRKSVHPDHRGCAAGGDLPAGTRRPRHLGRWQEPRPGEEGSDAGGCVRGVGGEQHPVDRFPRLSFFGMCMRLNTTPLPSPPPFSSKWLHHGSGLRVMGTLSSSPPFPMAAEIKDLDVVVPERTDTVENAENPERAYDMRMLQLKLEEVREKLTEVSKQEKLNAA